MCGIAGILSKNTGIIHKGLLQKFADTLAHRGPDGEGFYINDHNTIGFAHRRLAIIDLTTAGEQPMHFANRYTIVFNGEIYNYKELRSDLKKVGYHFTTNSDTEVILATYDYYKNECVKYFEGMFAFAIWDNVTNNLFCARDTFGEKPFYYFIDNEIFAFASEMKALWAIGIHKIPDEKMMVNFLSLGQVQNPSNSAQTFYKNIFSLPPAHTAVFNLNSMECTITKYRDINKENTVNISQAEAIKKLEELLLKSIKNRLRSDVPVGCSLSGGLDSTTIAYGIKQINNNQNFNTFSAIFKGFEKDESALIQQFCQANELKNYSVSPTVNELLTDFEKLCYHQEEPFASASIFAQYKVYQLAKTNNVTVLLDGQGADEVLGGYTKYLHWYLQDLVGHFKFGLAKQERRAFQKNDLHIHWGIKNILATYLPAHAAIALEKRELAKVYADSTLSKELLQTIKGNERQGIYKPVINKLNDILYYNTMQHGLEELLRYADRNSMANGVEVRLPFLNVELVNFIFSLPAHFKIKNGFTKNILRQTMANKLPNEIVWNPVKTGFEPPQKTWMKNQVMHDYLHTAKEKLVHHKILNTSVLSQKIKPQHAHDADNVDWRYLSLAAVL